MYSRCQPLLPGLALSFLAMSFLAFSAPPMLHAICRPIYRRWPQRKESNGRRSKWLWSRARVVMMPALTRLQHHRGCWAADWKVWKSLEMSPQLTSALSDDVMSGHRTAMLWCWRWNRSACGSFTTLFAYGFCPFIHPRDIGRLKGHFHYGCAALRFAALRCDSQR